MKKPKAKILLVEDDNNLAMVLKDFLEIQKYEVQLESDGEKGYQAFRNSKFDLCLLDVMMPIKDGFTLAREIRELNEDIPIIFLTAKSMKEDKIEGFKSGADDYISKPFSTEELNLRIEAVLKRFKYSNIISDKEKVFEIGKLMFDYTNLKLTGPNSEKKLTKREAEVLRMLALNKGKILRRDIALKNIWGEDDYFMGRSMDVYITKLRKYLKADENISIINVHGTGFKLEVENE